MQLVLEILLLFALVGLVSRRFDARQQLIVTVGAVLLASAQFFFARFL